MKKIILNISLVLFIPIMMIGCDGQIEPVPVVTLEKTIDLNYNFTNYSDSLKVGDTVHISLTIPNRFDSIMGGTFYRILDNSQTKYRGNSITMIPPLGFWVRHLDSNYEQQYVSDFLISGGRKVPFWDVGKTLTGTWVDGILTADFIPSKPGYYIFDSHNFFPALPVHDENGKSFTLPVNINFLIDNKLTEYLCTKDTMFKKEVEYCLSNKGEIKAFYVK